MRKWTEEQSMAVNAEDCSVIVSAAAGSGKTSVLVERLIRIIADSEKQIPVEKMIVVTFTKDAAAEMKQRLSVSLSRLIENDPENSWLARQNSMLGSAAISTISSFCIDLLRKNICQLSFSSGFRIADETEETLLKAEAYKSVSEYFYRERYDDMMKLRNNFCGTNDYKLEKLTEELHECISSVPFFELWLDSAEKKYDSGEFEEIYRRGIEVNIKKCESILKSAESSSERLGNQTVSDIISLEKSSFEKAAAEFRKNDFAGFNETLSSISFKTFPRAKKTDDPELRNAVYACRCGYKRIMTELVKSSAVYRSAGKDMEQSREILKTVSDFLKRFDRELLALKEKKNIIGFDDAERLVLKLLAEVKENGSVEKTALAEELSTYYELIMVDEFQDSNNRQDMIFRLLSKGGTAEKYGSDLFFVGDVKQSIYRFRLANPDNFISAMESSVPYKNGNTDMSYIRLSRNFRSSKEVIDFSNYIFSCLMTRQCGDIDYTEDEYLYQGASFCDADRKPVVMLYNKSESIENPEAKAVAEKISQMLKEGTPVSTDGGRSSRPCEMRDFCILMRGNSDIKTYAGELEKLGINSDGNGTAGYLKAREVSVLINLLRVTDNPLLDTPLMSVMLSPMFMFTPDEAALIRLVDNKSPLYMNLCRGIGANGEAAVFEGSLLAKSVSLHSIITELRLYVSAYTLQELIRKIYDRTDFTSVIQLYGDAERKKANLRMLLEYAGSYEKNSDGGLSGFIRYIDRVTESGGDFGQAADTGGSQNAVSVKTMHKSKGLEFPFVFIVGTERRFNREDSKKDFQFSYEMGLGFKIQNPEKYQRYAALPYEVINSRSRLSSAGEELRLLYVAMTRAKERLFITMNCDSSAAEKAAGYAEEIYAQNGITPELTASAGSMSDWLMMCLISHSKSAKLRELFGIYESFRYDNDFEIEYEVCVPEDKKEESIRSSEGRREAADAETVRRLKEMFSFDYDMSLSALTAKLSVSDISKYDSEFEALLRRPEFSGNTGGLTPAEKGTALHKFFQFADFSILETDIGAELDRLFDTGYLTAEQRDSIRHDDVRAFMKSGLYERIKKCGKFYREKKFLIAIDELELDNGYGEEYRNTSGMLNGIIDMVLEFEDHLVLVDYKTDRVSDVNELVRRYSPQLFLYRKVLEKTETKPVKETLIYSFYKKTEIKLP